MHSLVIEISRHEDDSFPGWVECVLVDAFDKRHLFVEKVSIVSLEPLDKASAYPQQGAMACVVEARWCDEDGRRVARVCTSQPWGIESSEGISRFVVLESQLTPASTPSPDGPTRRSTHPPSAS
jgi:hypothetical protein